MSGKSYTIEELLGASFDCECGHTHSTQFANYIRERGAIRRLPVLLKKIGYQHPFLISDTHTHAAAGAFVEDVLKEAGIPFKSHVLKSPEIGNLPADEYALGSVAMDYEKDCDLVVSVGTGTINDLGRYFSHIMGMEFILVATAPSMDGLVSGVAPLICNNFKTTFPAHAPLALVCDLDVLCKAPMKMLSAGAADILGKYNSLNEWKLSHIINDEYYCPVIAGIMKNAVDKTVESVPGLTCGDEQAIANLTDALTLSGMAMDFCGNSRPASGAEHHQAHYWEMQFLFDHKPAVLHGTKVGIGTVLILDVYNQLAKMEKPDFEKIRSGIKDRMSKEAWQAEMKRAYREGADSIISLEEKAGKNDPEKLLKRLQVIEEKWDEIRTFAGTVPQASMIYDLLKQMNAACVPGDVEVKKEYVYDSLRYAKELRDRYTVLQLMWDIGMLPDIAEGLVKKYCTEE